MKKTIITLAILTSMSSAMAVAEEAKADIDMSDPTDVYTTLGLAYGDAGLDFKGMLMLSSTENMLNEHVEKINPLTGDEVSTRSYRLRWGTINTQNGLGWSIDAINAEHPFFGNTTVIQTGPNMTIPVGDSFLIWPIVYVGGVLVENNDDELRDVGYPISPEFPVSSEGVGIDIASGIVTGMIYARYAITDQLWALGSYSYTTDISGKSWSDKVEDGGLEMASSKYDLTIGYQFTDRQNVTLIYRGDDSDATDDSFAVGYNYAF